MSKFKAGLLLLLCLPNFLMSGRAQFTQPRSEPRKYDRNMLRAEVDETQALLDSLGRESRSLDKTAHEDLLKSLANDHDLAGQVGYARKAMEQVEEMLEIQDAIRSQQRRLKDVLGDSTLADKEEQRLLGLQSDLLAVIEDLREGLTKQQKSLNETSTRDYRNWIMVSEGLLRQRREESAASAAPTPEAAPISAEDVTPTAATGLTSSAKP
jgi:hypothetical protein